MNLTTQLATIQKKNTHTQVKRIRWADRILTLTNQHIFPSESFAAIFKLKTTETKNCKPIWTLTDSTVYVVMCQMLFYYYLFLVGLNGRKKTIIYCIKHTEKFILKERNLRNCFNNFNNNNKPSNHLRWRKIS